MNNKDILNKFREIVEESREEDIYHYYIDLRNTLELLEKLEKENEILNNKQAKIIADSFHEKMAEKFNEDFIPKSKVREKIEELDSIYQQEIKQKYNGRYYHQLSYAIQILKKLEGDK